MKSAKTQGMTVQDIAALTVADVMTDESRVACVRLEHPLQHALLILIKSGYSAVPVLDVRGHVAGTIRKTRILDRILGLERIEFERLDEYVVRDALNPEVPRLRPDAPFVEAVQRLIDAPFTCVEAPDGAFLGIVTRRAVLAQLHPFVRGAIRAGDAHSSGADVHRKGST